MYAPIYLPQREPPSPEVAAIERAVIEDEGPLHVGGRYFAKEADAREERRRFAERWVRETARVTGNDECWTGQCDGSARFRLSTWLTPRERQQIDAAAPECVRSLHRDELGTIYRDLERNDADGALVSAGRISRQQLSSLTAIVRGFPAYSIIGIVGDVPENVALAASVLFGQAGVLALADVRTARGWQEFRRLCDCAQQPDAFMRSALSTVLREIANGDEQECTSGLAEFFRCVFTPRLTSAKELANKLGVQPSTLMSKFFRAGLPSPRQYVAFARLVWAAHLGEQPALSISAIANRLNASSPQSFHRYVRTLMGVSAAEFRRRYDGAKALELFRDRVVTPYRVILTDFDPVGDAQTTGRRSQSQSVKGERTAEPGRAA